jgi:hypothetical protein
MSRAGSPIAEAERGAVESERRLDGTILDIRRLGNLSVPFRLSPGSRGVAHPSSGSHPNGGRDEDPLDISNGQRSGNLALGVL